MTRLLLIRHATTDAVGKHLSGRMQGVPLNDEGRLQAQNLALRLQGVPISAIYSSPLQRAVETATAIATEFKIQHVIRDDFNETDFGDWTGLAFKDLENKPAFKLFNSFRSLARVPGGEMMLEAQLRVITGLEKLCVQHPNETIAVVSHSDLIKSAISYYAGSTLDLLQRIEISPASYSVIEIYEEAVRIVSVNNTGEFPF